MWSGLLEEARHMELNRHHNQGQNIDFFMRCKIEFPAFDYDHPMLWISRCESFFMMSHVPRDEILTILYVNLIGKVGVWFGGYLNGLRAAFQWDGFADAVCRRFSDGGTSVMEDFSVFKQFGGVVEFTNKFEEFRGLLFQADPHLIDEYFIENYIARLKQNLRCFERTTKPRTLEDAIWFSK